MGLELKFLKNRIGLDFTYYSQISKTRLWEWQVPGQPVTTIA